MSLRCLAVLGLVAAVSTPALADDEAATRAAAITRAAESVARRGECSALPAMAAAVRELDPFYYDDTFAKDPVIAACAQGIDTTLPRPTVELPAPVAPVQVARVDAPAGSVPTTALVARAPEAPSTCSGVRGFFEPSLWTGQDGTVLRHAVGVSLHECHDADGGIGLIGLRVGAHLDLGTSGSYFDADAELSYPVTTKVSLGLLASHGSTGTGPESLAGLRVRTKYVWFGVDWMKTGNDGAMTSSSGVMFGLGLGGKAGIAVGTAEAYALYAIAEYGSIAMGGH
jgi:hypothetical protein